MNSQKIRIQILHSCLINSKTRNLTKVLRRSQLKKPDTMPLGLKLSSKHLNLAIHQQYRSLKRATELIMNLRIFLIRSMLFLRRTMDNILPTPPLSLRTLRDKGDRSVSRRLLLATKSLLSTKERLWLRKKACSWMENFHPTSPCWRG